MLLPLTESGLFQLDLLGESFAESFLLFSVFRVIELFDFWFAKFTGFHLRESVCLVVVLFGGGDEIEHVRTDEQRTQFLEITVVVVLH